MTQFKVLVLPLLVLSMTACSEGPTGSTPPNESSATPVSPPVAQPTAQDDSDQPVAPAKPSAKRSSRERCGFDFEDESNELVRAQFFGSIEGVWRDKSPGFYNREVVDGTVYFSASGYEVNSQLGVLGVAALFYSGPSGNIPYAYKHGIRPMRQMRVSRPVKVEGFEGFRMLSVYDDSSGACWTSALRLNSSGELESTYTTTSYSSTLEDARAFFKPGYGFLTFVRTNDFVNAR